MECEVTQGRCFSPLSYCNEDQRPSPPNLGRCGAALPSSYFSCVGWEAQSAPSFTGNGWDSRCNSCTPAAQREAWKRPPCLYRLQWRRLMHHLSKLINPVARSRQSRSCSAAQCAPGLLHALMDSLRLAQLSWQEEKAHV